MKGGSPSADLSGLEHSLGHAFADRDLAVCALTHISAGSGAGGARSENYQRLEFLGDKVLGLVIADMLYLAYPRADEGELSRRLADLVRKETCAEVAAELAIGDHLRLGPGELQNGGRSRPAILADVCEALIGAMFVDGGFAAAAAAVDRLWRGRMLAPRRALRDPKTILQEWAQARGQATPAYREVDRSGPAHEPNFVVSVAVPGFAPAQGSGSSKRGAEQAAAVVFLAREGLQRLDAEARA